MGAYLSSPITTKETHEGESADFVYGVSAMQGWRTEMEDAHAVSLRIPSSKKAAKKEETTTAEEKGGDGSGGGGGEAKPESGPESGGGDPVPTAFFAVFDGHGGKEVARYAAEHMVEEIAAAPELAAAVEAAAAAKEGAGGAPRNGDGKKTAAAAAVADDETPPLASAPLPQSGPLPDAASAPARLLAATLERAYLRTDVRVCAPEARRELAAFAAGERDEEEEEEEEVGRGRGGEDAASRAGTALSLLLGGRGGAGRAAGGGGGGGAPVGGLSPAMVAALAEAGVQVRVARARRSRLEVDEEEEAEGEEGEEEEGEEEEDDDEGGGGGKKGKGDKKSAAALASAQRPPNSHRTTHATLEVEETEEVTISGGGSAAAASGPPGAAKRKRPAAAAAAAALPLAAKKEGGEEGATAGADDDAGTAAAGPSAADKGKASGAEDEEEIEEMEADEDDDEEEEEEEESDDDDDDGRPLPFARGGGGLAGLFGGANRGPPARLPDDAPTTELDPAVGGRYIGPSAGCTAVSALVRGDQLAVANAGDSRAVLCRSGGVALPLTRDHKPTEEPELGRILAAGGFVADGRVNGSLNLSRALGDAEHKQTPGMPPQAQAVTCAPDLSTVTLLPGDEFLLLCCDGIWDVLTCQEAVDFVRERLTKDAMSPAEAASALCDRCLAPDTGGCGKGCDNMSAMVVVLKRFAPPEVVEKAVESAKAFRAGRGPQSAAARPAKKG